MFNLKHCINISTWQYMDSDFDTCFVCTHDQPSNLNISCFTYSSNSGNSWHTCFVLIHHNWVGVSLHFDQFLPWVNWWCLFVIPCVLIVNIAATKITYVPQSNFTFEGKTIYVTVVHQPECAVMSNIWSHFRPPMQIFKKRFYLLHSISHSSKVVMCY